MAPGCQMAWGTNFCMLAPNNCGSLVRNLFHVTFLAPCIEADHRLFQKFVHPDFSRHYTSIWELQSSEMLCYVVWYKCTNCTGSCSLDVRNLTLRWKQQDTLTSEDTCTRLVMTSDELGLWYSREDITMRTSFLLQEKKFQVFLCI